MDYFVLRWIFSHFILTTFPWSHEKLWRFCRSRIATILLFGRNHDVARSEATFSSCPWDIHLCLLGWVFFGFNVLFRPPLDILSCFSPTWHVHGIFWEGGHMVLAEPRVNRVGLPSFLKGFDIKVYFWRFLEPHSLSSVETLPLIVWLWITVAARFVLICICFDLSVPPYRDIWHINMPGMPHLVC